MNPKTEIEASAVPPTAGSSSTNGESGDQAKKRPAPDQDQDEPEDPESGEAVTMVEVLQEEAELEADANAVLGAADQDNCTYFTKGTY